MGAQMVKEVASKTSDVAGDGTTAATLLAQVHDDFKTINAVACNINKNGLIFITKQPLQVGDPIFIKVKKLFREERNTELHEGVHAQVIWCHKTFNQQHDLCYKVAAEYF